MKQKFSKKKFPPRIFTFKLKASESKYYMKRFRIVMDGDKQEIRGKKSNNARSECF